MNYFNLNGKVSLITGASSGLGVHFANVLANEGATVILAARRTDKLATAVDAIREAGGKAFAIPMDVSNAESVANAFATIQSEHGGVDILVNNAGVADDPKKFLDTTEEDWNWVMETNLTGAWRVARAAALQMNSNNTAGSIINIGSIYGLHTGVMKVAYNVSKVGVVQLTKSMAMELCRKNIRVNALCPGWFVTEINDSYFSSESGQRYIQGFPSKRLGKMEDLSVPLLLLASNSAGAYMNGTTLTVDGGLIESPI
ncbi:SDR family NAD(P)-dependent oxidoreductase [Zhongshania marina]|uniref:2-deoxy-D-gluconate 3-dehydrogenase n=1 Tax=Zhongshania marina TaxID=2304603 RepID=A0A2S4HJM3_9GAMM|nr:SDR family oxidoreductase [Marortus luteolus]POP54185.1 2-deoxy-D-gluconate 3-dehydrogenase [Marortus luteolus]RNL60940.1 SDR family oxidoreductase [Zhongshania marina]